jgi:hypothetical protein
MKKLRGLMFALVLIAAPLATYAQVEANAGSMKLGVHMDIDYLWSQNNQHDPQFSGGKQELGWEGYDSFTAENLDLEVTGKVGDRVSYKILEALVYSYPSAGHSGEVVSIMTAPRVYALPLEAYTDLKVIDQLKFRIGKQMAPTLIANTPVHMANVAFTTNMPLIANDANGNAQVGFNDLVMAHFGTSTGVENTRMTLPGSVTGLSTIISFSGLEINWTIFDNWLDEDGPYFYGRDYGYDWNKSKGNNVALTYAGEVGPGKLTARAFWNSESVDMGTGAFHPVNNSSWGLGAMYNANKFFLGAEYASDTVRFAKEFWGDKRANSWNGAYVVVGGTFSSIQPVYRFDYIDYTSLGHKQIGYLTTADTEIWHTFALNYKVNDNVTLGLDYVVKSPEQLKHNNYPMINEFSFMTELNTL